MNIFNLYTHTLVFSITLTNNAKLSKLKVIPASASNKPASYHESTLTRHNYPCKLSAHANDPLASLSFTKHTNKSLKMNFYEAQLGGLMGISGSTHLLRFSSLSQELILSCLTPFEPSHLKKKTQEKCLFNKQIITYNFTCSMNSDILSNTILHILEID